MTFKAGPNQTLLNHLMWALTFRADLSPVEKAALRSAIGVHASRTQQPTTEAQASVPAPVATSTWWSSSDYTVQLSSTNW